MQPSIQASRFRPGRPLRPPVGLAALAVALILGGQPVTPRSFGGEDGPQGPRAAAWQEIQKALDEGRPKTALEKLRGIEKAATQEKAWAEAARAIATRILAETGDRPGEDP